MRLRRTAIGGLVLAVSVGLLPALSAPAQADPSVTSDPSTSSPSTGTGTETLPVTTDTPEDPRELAEDALAEAKDLLAGVGDDSAGPSTQRDPSPDDTDDTDDTGETEGSGEEESRDLTMILRDLAANAGSLPAGQRAEANRILARPGQMDDNNCTHLDPCYSKGSDVRRTCSDSVCVHWAAPAANDSHAVPAEDDGAGGKFRGTADNGIPDYVEQVVATVTQVAERYKRAGYRPAKSDGGRGGNNLPDVYLADLASPQSLVYGYCASDTKTPRHVAVSAYCVLDNDYSEFRNNTPVQNMQVTAAHEYFPAVQFAYDLNEDLWIMEATAVWAEDEVFDAINDNLIFLPYGPLGKPRMPLDTVGPSYHYGAWIFVRYLTERFRAEAGGMPVLVRELWNAMAHTGTGARGLYSLKALERVLRARGTTLAREFAWFTVRNRSSRQFYDEGRANRYPVAPLSGKVRMTARKSRHRMVFRTNHLSVRHLRVLPRAAGKRTLRIWLNTTPPRIGGSVMLTVKRKGAKARTVRLSQRPNGKRLKRVDFRRSRVAWVDIAVVNGSSAYRCNQRTNQSCDGLPLHDGVRQVVELRSVR